LSRITLALGLVVLAVGVAAAVWIVAAGDGVDIAWVILLLAACASVPIAFLLGALRGRLAPPSVTDVVVALQAGVPIRDALAEALDDPSLEIVYRLPGGLQWVDPDGTRVPEPQPSDERAVTLVEWVGLPIAALIHDAALSEDRELVETAAAAASLSLQNERLQTQVRAQVQMMTAITDTAPSLLVGIDTNGRILSQNRAAVETAGLDDQELVRGRYFWDVFISAEAREGVIERFRALAPVFAAGDYEHSFVNERGEERVVAWRTAPVLGPDGTVESIIAGGMDITERHRLAEEKDREREFLNAIANDAPSLLCLIDETGTVAPHATNKAFERSLGYEPAETGGILFWERYVDPSEADDVRRSIERVVAGEDVGEHDNHWLARTGHRLLIAWTCTPLPKVDERTMFLISGVDVTERKRREVELQRERDATTTVIQTIPSFIVVLDVDGAIVDRADDHHLAAVNRAFHETLGWTDEQLIGRQLVELLAEEDRDVGRWAITTASGGGLSGELESQWQRADGSVIVVAWRAAPVADATGRRSQLVLVTGMDVTERKRHEEDVRASRSRLVAAADDARRRLERNLHDGAQQRLVALSVSLRLAESKLLDDPALAASILASARRELAQALEELRELARGIHPAVLTDRGLKAAVDGLVSRSPVPVRADVVTESLEPAVEAAVYYVISESLANVAKYAEARSVDLRVAATDDFVTVTVADDGVGGADPLAGSGLRGLADRLAALDGTLSVESPPGAGTRVRGDIPVRPHAPAT
jgi:PAS domain S-box-containing protein